MKIPLVQEVEKMELLEKILAGRSVDEETFTMQSGRALVLISCILGTISITFPCRKEIVRL